MKETNKDVQGFLKNKGFYVALYGAVAVLLGVAIFVSYRNSGTEKELLTKNMTEEELLEDYFSQYETAEKADLDSWFYKPELEIEDEAKLPIENDNPDPVTIGETDTLPVGSSLDESFDEKDKLLDDEEEVVPETETPAVETKEPKTEEIVFLEPKISYFNATEDLMGWPVTGDIVVEFSPHTGVFDITLEQYKTNDTICIAAPKGTEVRAAAEGYVYDISYSDTKGRTVTIDHGNGWRTTYSQLQDDVLVELDDVVMKGEIIGGVADPTRNRVLLGTHLEFKVTENNETIDPRLILMD